MIPAPVPARHNLQHHGSFRYCSSLQLCVQPYLVFYEKIYIRYDIPVEIIATSAEIPPNGGLIWFSEGIPPNSGLGIIVI